MPTLKIATWNVNSLRVRLPHVLAWLHEVKPDVLAMQEIKLTNEDFPYDALREAGFHSIVSGQKTYNGVAIISREPLTNVVTELVGFEDHQKRILSANYKNIRIVNLYVPNGEKITSPKYVYKLNWLQHLDFYLQDELSKHQKIILLGDFNIAPEAIDVHDPMLWIGKVMVSDAERDAFQRMIAQGFKDCFRLLSPDEKIFTWWDYRLLAFQRNLGLRIDHILATDAVAIRCAGCYIDGAPRAWEKPSDHAPVVAEFNFYDDEFESV